MLNHSKCVALYLLDCGNPINKILSHYQTITYLALSSKKNFFSKIFSDIWLYSSYMLISYY